MVIVLVEIGGVEAERAFLAAIGSLPAVTECHHVTGDFSYMLKVRVASTRAFEDLLNSHIKNLAGIRRTQSLIVLSSTKDSRQLPVTLAGETP
jgi:Lrp/AsnC family leucine-responsive transcriptional regulator